MKFKKKKKNILVYKKKKKGEKRTKNGHGRPRPSVTRLGFDCFSNCLIGFATSSTASLPVAKEKTSRSIEQRNVGGADERSGGARDKDNKRKIYIYI
jgi:hypothetical protein